MLKDNIVHHKQNVEHRKNSNKYTQQVRRWDTVTCKRLKLKLIDIRYKVLVISTLVSRSSQHEHRGRGDVEAVVETQLGDLRPAGV